MWYGGRLNSVILLFEIIIIEKKKDFLRSVFYVLETGIGAGIEIALFR